MVFEIVRWVNSLRHTARYLEHAGQSDHHHVGEVLTHAAETYAGVRRYDRKRHEARLRNPVTMWFWFRRTSHKHPKNRG